MKDIFTSYFAQAIGLAANFIGGVIAARLLLPVGRGELGQVMLWPTFIATLGAFSIGDAIIYFIAGERSEPKRVMASAFAIGAALSVILMAGGLVALPYLYAGYSPEVEHAALFFLLYIPVGTAAFYAVCAFQGLGRFTLWNLLRILVSCAYAAIALAIWVLHDATVMSFTVAALLANLAVYLTGAFFLRRIGAFGVKPNARVMWEMFSYGARLHVGNLLALANQRLDQILVTWWLPAAQFGYYLVAIAIYNSASLLVTLLGSLLFPKIAAAVDDAARAETMGRYLRLALLLSLGGGLLLLIIAPWLVTLVYGKAYLPTVAAVRIFAVGIAPTACKALLTSAFKAVGRPRTIIASEFISLVAIAAALLILVRPFGIAGAALSCIIAQVGGLVVLAIAVRRQLGIALLPLFTPSAGDFSLLVEWLRESRRRARP